jgi:molybdate transport system permease protein
MIKLLKHAAGMFLEDGYSKWWFLIPGGILLALFVLPLILLVVKAVNSDFIFHALSGWALNALRLSLVTSSITTLIAATLGTPLAYMLARWKFKAKPAVEIMIDLPIVLPPSVAGLALLIAFGRNGFLGPAFETFGINLPFTTAAVVLAQSFVSAPLFVRAARIGFAQVDLQLEEAARVEGANLWQLFTTVMIPLTGHALLSGGILTWTRALGEFGATILFAGNLEGVTQTMPMAIYLGFERDIGIALVLSVVLILVSIILLSLTRRLDRRDH